MLLNDGDRMFSSFREACAWAREVAIKTGKEVAVTKTLAGWHVPGLPEPRWQAKTPPYRSRDVSSQEKSQWHSWDRPESESQRNARIAEMNDRVDQVLEEKVRREINDSKNRQSIEVCEACGRPLHACRCGL